MNPSPTSAAEPHPAPTIERVETLLLDLPTIRPHRLSVATMDGQTLMLVRIHCSDGVIGVGEGTTIGGLAYGGESPEGMKLAVDTYFTPLLRGADATRVPALMTRIDSMIKDNRFARSAVETALLDAQGKRTGLPVSELLGGRRRDRLAVAWTLASGDTARDIDEAEQMLELRRHNVFKLKIGAKALDEDIAHVAAIKRALGDRAAVRVDVNMAWSELQAARGMAALADAGCELVEQPVATAAALARLVRRFPTALMADESLHGPRSAFELAKAAGATRFCMGAAWRSPKDRDMGQVLAMVRGVKSLGMETCMTLGMLDPDQAQDLAAAGRVHDDVEFLVGEVTTPSGHQLDPLASVPVQFPLCALGVVVGHHVDRGDHVRLGQLLAGLETLAVKRQRLIQRSLSLASIRQRSFGIEACQQVVHL